MSSAEALSSYF